MTWNLVASGVDGFADGNAGHLYTFPGGAANAGDLLVIYISSNTTVSTPAGWQRPVFDVHNIGAYGFYLRATGGETSATITTAGNEPTALTFARYTGAAASPLDVVASAFSIVSGAAAPAVTTAALAQSGELSAVGGCLGGLQGATQINPVWSSGYTARLSAQSLATTVNDQHLFYGDNQNAGPAAQSPTLSWTGPTNNQTILVMTFKASGAAEVQLAADLTATGGMGATLTVEKSLAADLTATGGMTVADVVETTLAASLTARASMSATLSVPSGPTDPIAAPVANALLACLTEQMNQLPSPPARIQLRVGSETGPLIGPNVDECCAGLAWVRVADVYPSWDSFPGPDNTWTPCGPLAYAVVLEMGTAFCMPWSDSDDGFDNVDPPNTDDWATAFNTLMQHQTLMRRAAACCFAPTQRRAVGEWAPLSVEGGCTGGTLRVTVSVMAPCSDC